MMKRKKSLGGEKDGKGQPKPGSAKRQGTIGQAFAMANSKVSQLPFLEVSESSSMPINNYDSQNIRNTLDHYLSELKRKRQLIPAADETVVQGRASRQRRSYVSDEHAEYREPCKAQLQEQDASLGDEDAYRFLCQIQELTSRHAIPTGDQLANIVRIMRGHGIHGRRDLSSLAFRLLQRVGKIHPSVSVQHTMGENSTPFVLVNTSAWCLTGGCEGFSVDQFEDEPLERRILPFQILDHLVTLAHRAIIPSPVGKESARSVALTSGDLYLLKWVVEELQADLDARMEVYWTFPGQKFDQQKTLLSQRKAALLQNSQLWRIFSDSAKTYDCDRKALVAKLMEIIAAPADAEYLQTPKSLEEYAFNPGELAQIAAKLLRQMLELYGTAENAKMFLKYTINRAASSGALDNVRMLLETAMVDGLLGSNQVLKTLPQKRAFLQAIHQKDCLRLLNMIVAIKHARRSKDDTTYPSLERFNHVYNSHGDAEAYLQAEPTEALQYILNDFALAFNIMDKTADGLALLVSAICQAAAEEVSGEKLGKVKESLEKIMETFAKQTTANKCASTDGLLALQAAKHALSACA